MDYTLSAIAVCIVFSLAYCYGLIVERKHRLVQAYLRLDDLIHNQALTIKQLCCTASNVPNLHALHAFTRQNQAIRTLGLYAIDQRIEVYTNMYGQALHLINLQNQNQTVEYQQHVQTLKNEHTRLKKARALYNQAALKYNDCQRNAIQDWCASRLGHQMAPPC